MHKILTGFAKPGFKEPDTWPENKKSDGFGLHQLGSLSNRAYRKIRELVYENSGIDLTEHKRTLIIGRLQKILRARGFQNFDQYIAYLESDKKKEAIVELINHISTNHTYFYRESAHFDYFKNKVLPETTSALKKKNANDLRVWSAGCSSGEEPYMLVMLMLEYFQNDYDSWDAGILATDISTKALTAAIEGVYSEERLGLLPLPLRRKYFKKAGENTWAIDDRIKREVVFRRFNLMTPEFPFKKKFHAIFCRNVMIYFDIPTRKKIVEKMYDVTRPGGYLFIGHSETLGRERNEYKFIMPAVYRKSG